MLLFFDTETTGLPRNWKAPVSDTNNWPRMVQIAWLTYDNEGNPMEQNDFIIQPEGYTIPSKAASIHGISTERAKEEGRDLKEVLEKFAADITRADYLVAHNISFDEKIVGAEFIRKQITSQLFNKNKICTMQTSTNFCKLPGPYGYKWPTLSELHKILFGKDFQEAHNAAVDINATANCFWELRRRGIL